MGFNTVAMILNDHMNELEKAPQSLAYALCHPPMHGDKSMEMWKKHFIEKMRESGERLSCVYPLGGLNILPTFHADDVHYIYAGKNSLVRLQFHKFGTAKVPVYEKVPGGLEKLSKEPKEVRTVTLILPDWATER